MNYDYLLNIKPKYHLFFITVIIILIVSLIIIVFKFEVYESYNCLGIYNESYIYLNVPIDYSDTLTSGDYLKINDKKYTYQIKEISDIDVDSNMINYQTYILEVDENFLENEVLDITIFFKKEKIIEKIKEHI